MSSRFSKLALAATGILAASLTCFAQNDSLQVKAESTGIVVVAANTSPKLDDGLAKYGTAAKTNKDVSLTGNTFSHEKFMTAARQSMTKTTPNFMTASSFEPRKDEFVKSAAPKRIEFVPSLGQKLPE